MKYEVIFSPDINMSDTVVRNGKTETYSLYGTSNSSESVVILYMYILPQFYNHGIKVGMTVCRPRETFYNAIKKRIEIQEHELALSEENFVKYGQKREVIYWGVCLDAKNDSFKDYYVHKQILARHSGIAEKGQEWFRNIPTDTLIEEFEAIRRKGIKREIYSPRAEQKKCIEALHAYFDKTPQGGRFLLNCKMRFGKCYTTYRYCEEANINRILILTFIPAVEASWKDDLEHIEKRYKYYTDKNISQPLFRPDLTDEPYVLFLSLQNFLGKYKNTRTTKEKIEKLREEHFDLVVLDEYHFGAWNSRTQEKFEDFDEDYQKQLKKEADVIEKFGIKTDKIICLSGTPFKAIARGEFTQDNTYTYSYFDEQKNKYPENDFSNPAPQYAQFPDMKIFGYNMSALFGNLTGNIFSGDKMLGKKYFSLNKFFETRKDSDTSEPATFLYAQEICQWLEIIKGRSVYGMSFPYSNMQMLENSKHTLWLMPTVNACIAMAELLQKDEYFSRYEIINLSHPDVGTGVDAYNYLLQHIAKADNTNKLGSIALTVNKLTTGVTVKEWFGVFVLKDLSAPEQYFQSIFRIQTPLVVDEEIKKKVGYVYDFNIDRAAALLLKYAEETADQQITKLEISKLIVKYLPIFMNGDMETPIEYEVFYQLAMYGDKSSIPLSRKITDLAQTTHFENEETIAAMLNDPSVSDVLKRIFAHSKLKKSKATKKPVAPEEGFSTEAAKRGRDLGYKFGLQDSNLYLELDDEQVQNTFECNIETYVKQNLPQEYSDELKIWWTNGFKNGYENGVNVPVKKLNCGRSDGEKYVEKVREKFGKDVCYTKDTRPAIENFVRKYLSDINNIPQQYRKKLYKRWYAESFLKAVKNNLVPVIHTPQNALSQDDASNALRHILGRLVQFLYISVYREMTFREIFQNADPNVFLEAVGIRKNEFETLNKYHVFEENTLNNYIHEFFVNESLGAYVSSNQQNPNDRYRNSFGWFGYNKIE